MISLFGIVLGLLALIGGGAALVQGASQAATRMGVSPLIVGLTVVSFGTSAPELVVNVIGALRGETALAFGNVIGSNVANLGLVLGLAAALRPIELQGQVVRREVPLLLLVTTIMAVMALDGPVDGLPDRIVRSDALVLLLLIAIFVYIIVLDFVRSRQSGVLATQISESPMVVAAANGRYSWLMMIFGSVLLFAGAEFTVRSSVDFAAQVGISTTVVGLFVVAIGTSAPELVTSIIAALRGQSDLALGNIVGSNIFNLLFVLPTSSLIKVISVPVGGVADLVVSWLFAAALIPIFYFGRARLGRTWGIVLVIAYFTYVIFRSLLSVN